MSTPNALFLLADHIKLSLLEQKRAKNLNLRRDSQDGHISRSLDQFREGLESIEKEQLRLEEAGEESKATSLNDTLKSLRKQYADLTSQFTGRASSTSTSTLTHPNDPSLAADFAHAQSEPSSNDQPPSPPPASTKPYPPTTTKKAVRFSSPATDLESQSQSQPYRDNPSPSSAPAYDDDTAGYRDHITNSNLSNTQIHSYHRAILDDQDAQLDALGASISRQRELSMRIGDELDEHVLMLDESERAATRQANTLERARRQLGRITRGAAESGEGRQLAAIVVLIIILVLLIAVLK